MRDTADMRRAIGARIREARINATLAQEELAALVGVGRGTISRWETGTRAVPSALLPRLAAALRTTVAHLTGEQSPAVGSSYPVTAPQAAAKGWPSIDQSHLHELERDTIVQIVSRLVEKPELLPAVLDIILDGPPGPSQVRTREQIATAILTQLRTVNINELTPVGALRVLADLQDQATHSD